MSKGGNSIYSISLVAPDGPAQLQSLQKGIGMITAVEVLGLGEVPFRQSESGLEVSLPESFAPELGYVVKVDFSHAGYRQGEEPVPDKTGPGL